MLSARGLSPSLAASQTRLPGLEPGTCGLEDRWQPLLRDSFAKASEEGQEQLGVLLGVLATEINPVAPDLSVVLTAWLDLPEVVKTGILAMAKSALGDRREG